ncbi:hypothetical protein [Neisseria canis]|uniref:hypothetical protein n=1 Tax=Neisseria canis TaxID=493 RepID=UPI000F8177AF|nr:hypothetical protein [Neisseria canis]
MTHWLPEKHQKICYTQSSKTSYPKAAKKPQNQPKNALTFARWGYIWGYLSNIEIKYIIKSKI